MTDRSTRPPALALLGEEIRIARDGAGLTQAQLGERVNYSVAMLSMVETAQRAPRRDLIEALDRELCTAGRLVRLWLVASNESATARIAPLIEAEQRATLIREYHPVLVPGLLQTEPYARALMANALFSGADAAEIDELVAQRIGRQTILDSGGVRYSVVLDEGVLHRTIGDADTMREQLHHLLTMMRRRRVTIQIMRFSAGSYPASGPMLIYDVDGGVVVHFELPVGDGRTTSNLGMVEECVEQFDLIRSQTEPLADSVRMVERRVEELEP